ncbi:MAG: tRNA dihydrouridine(20/20a) synthase DusA [Alphaproteobacteria bacterium]|nr:tRNA dihydrouridine(20/20a) synthase DusA [Alphaproteobacteria bacterium]
MNQVKEAKAQKKINSISVAPMMDWTDRHCRYFHRLISPSALLYTEMVTTGAIIFGDRDRFLRFSDQEHPVALQLGGSDPKDLAECTKIGEDYGYDEINLNCGCPSDRVQKGMIGACLMKEPNMVGDAVNEMINAVKIPVTVKCRIGIDEYDNDAFLHTFIETVKQAGCKTFIIHARKAWLQGLSPKENRTKPPIDYDRVARMKAAHPELDIIINGDITTVQQARTLLERFDGVMLGREAYQNPWILSELENEIFKNETKTDRENVALSMIPYAQEQNEKYSTPIKSITRHIIGLYHEQPGAKKWRQTLSTLPYEDGADAYVIEKALNLSKGDPIQSA